MVLQSPALCKTPDTCALVDFFFFSSRRRHTRFKCDWSSDVCSSDLTRQAVAAGWQVLEKGGSALDAAEESVVVMEDDEAFDAGRGSFLNREGKVQLDALIMDGATLRAGGVGCVEHIANPVRAARKVLSART